MSVFLLSLILEPANSFFSQYWVYPGQGVDPKLRDVSYPHSEINGIIASYSEGLPEGKTDNDFWQQQCRDDQAFLKGKWGDCKTELVRLKTAEGLGELQSH